MSKKVMGAFIISVFATQAMASHAIKCTSGVEAINAAKNGYVCEGSKITCMNYQDAVAATFLGYTCESAQQQVQKPEPKKEGKSATTLKREQVQCKIELAKQCGTKIQMEPLDDSGCIIGKEKGYSRVLGSFEETNYVAYYNLGYKLVTVVDTAKCASKSTYVYGKLSQQETFDNKLFIVMNGKVVFVDSHGKFQEILSARGYSYATLGAYAKQVIPSVDGKTLKIIVGVKNKSTIVEEKISAADLKDSRRIAELAPSTDLVADAKVIRTKADVIE